MKAMLAPAMTCSIRTAIPMRNGLAVRPVDSINCGYIVIDYVRDNIETNYCPFALCDKIKIDKYIC